MARPASSSISNPAHTAQTLKDFEPDSFLLEKYVEKLAQLDPNTGLGPLSKKKDMPFDPKVLLNSFRLSLDHLQSLNDKIQTRVEKLEFLTSKKEKEHAGRVKELEPMFQEAFNEFHVLEDRITYVARKVVHLGDQLEATNSHRNRDIEAKELMEMMKDFKEKVKISRPEFSDPTRLTEGAELINKLNSLAGELPTIEKYATMRENIATKYAEIERQLVEKFREALSASDVKRMNLYANTLRHFQTGYDRCILNYIGHHQAILSQSSGGGTTEDVFRSVESRCTRVYKQMTEVFYNPEEVMMKMIQSVTDGILQDHVNKELSTVGKDMEKYLQKLYHLHIRAMVLRDSLSGLGTKIDKAFLTKTLRLGLFSEHLAGYAEAEVNHLRAKSEQLVNEFYSQANIVKKTNNIVRVGAPIDEDDPVPEDHFMSENVCTTILYESKCAIKRCHELLSDRELSHTMREIYFTILDVLCTDHFSTALELSAEVKVGPAGVFLQVVGCVNKNIHLMEKQFRELIIPLIQYAPVATVCNERKRDVMHNLEMKIEAGIERVISIILSTFSQILAAQKKSDYKPDTPEVTQASYTCLKAVQHVGKSLRVIQLSLDGKNQEVVLLELGVSIYRALYDHILTFTVNSNGAMSLICDVNEYRRVMKEFGVPMLEELFSNLQTLCNIFIVMPENLKQVCSEEPYISFDRNTIMKMIQLRADYKSAKLAKIFNP